MIVGFNRVVDKKNEIHTVEDLTQEIIAAITEGFLTRGSKLPSVNKMSALVGLNRLTVLKSLDELEIEGWITKKVRSGSFVAEQLPVNMPQEIGSANANKKSWPELVESRIKPIIQNYFQLSFNDGYPDHRLFPSSEMARVYSTTFKDNRSRKALLYYDVYGHDDLRDQLCRYVSHSRSINAQRENIFISRGATMGIFLSIKCVCRKEDKVVMGDPGYYSAREAFRAEGLEVLTIDVDENGINTDKLRELLKRHTIKLLYVTPHHQYPTTVSLPASRRMELLTLAEEHNFYILEDDYDFDFQYDRRPILPIASIDQLNRVIYVGGFSKSLSPSIRMGYVVANPAVIKEMGKWRRIIDRQGDTIQEIVFATLLKTNVIDKAIRKAMKIYKERRDVAYNLLKSELSIFSPNNCDGGLAFWTGFNCTLSEAEKFYHKALQSNVFLPDPKKYSGNHGVFTRLGFASMTTEEIEECVSILVDIEKSS